MALGFSEGDYLTLPSTSKWFFREKKRLMSSVNTAMKAARQAVAQ